MKKTINKIFFYTLISIYGVNAIAITEINNKVSANSAAEYVLPDNTTPYALALKSGITFDQLNSLNDGKFKANDELVKGMTVKLPVSSSLVAKDTSTLTSGAEQIASTLPNIGGETSAFDESVAKEVLNYSGLNSYVGGTTEENVAKTLSQAASEDWSNVSLKDVTDKTVDNAKNRVKGEVTGKITEAASNFLGRFGKAEVNLSVDDNGNLEGSSINLLSPLYDQGENLIFSQVGVHGQGSGNESRTIGNFGLGYRYETEGWLAGGNAFIDHDFSGNNTRLGLGAEYWQDNLKLSTNLYTPISGWKESDVMKNYEALIYDERAARGFDIRAKGYIPSYPQLGGSFVFEQYYGDEVALFNAEERQKDPYAFTLGLNYTPIPLITTELSHKIGKGGQEDTRLDLNLNLQLGTPLEAQLDPANVAVARSLKGSRYDMVDRNYDIVFEYRKEDFALSINGPEQAMLGTDVTVTSAVRSRADIESYEWIVTDMVGNIIPKGNNSGKSLTFTINDYIDHYVRLKVKTVRGYEATSEPLRVQVLAAQSKSTLTANDSSAANVIAFSELPINFGYNDLNSLPVEDKKQLLFTAYDIDGKPYDLTQNPGIRIDWRLTGTSGDSFKQYEPTTDLVHFEWIPGDQPNEVKLIVIADKAFIEKVGGSKSIDVLVSSELDKTVFAQTSIQFINSDSTLTELGIDPNNMVIQIWKLADVNTFNTTDDLVSQSGFINNQVISTVKAPIEQGQAYRVKILTSFDAVANNDPNSASWTDVTDKYVDGIVWLYWDPANQVEITANKNQYQNPHDASRTYKSLEGCRASSTFVTQLNNYNFNELAWGAILEQDDSKTRADRTINEQGLRLAVQFDFTTLNEPKDLKGTLCKVDSNNADVSYAGYLNGNIRAVAWSEAE